MRALGEPGAGAESAISAEALPPQQRSVDGIRDGEIHRFAWGDGHAVGGVPVPRQDVDLNPEVVHDRPAHCEGLVAISRDCAESTLRPAHGPDRGLVEVVVLDVDPDAGGRRLTATLRRGPGA